MSAKKYKIFNGSEIEFFQQHFSNRVQSWAQSWAPEVQCTVDVSNADNNAEQLIPIFKSENILNFTNGETCFAISGWGEDFISTFPLALCSSQNKTADKKASSVISTFAKKAVEELIESICQNEIVCSGVAEKNQDLLGDINTVGISGLAVVIEIAGQKIYSLLNTKLAVDILAANNKLEVINEKITLVKRSSGLGKELLNVELEIGEAEIDFASLQALSKGDVIAFDKKATDALDVKVVDGEIICKGYLGKLDGATSVQLIRG